MSAGRVLTRQEPQKPDRSSRSDKGSPFVRRRWTTPTSGDTLEMIGASVRVNSWARRGWTCSRSVARYSAALITGIRSDQVTALVTKNIYDTPTGRIRLMNQCLESNDAGPPHHCIRRISPVRFRKRCNGSGGVHSKSTLFEESIIQELAVSAIRIAPSPSTVPSFAPASLAARTARAISACVTLAGRRGTITSPTTNRCTLPSRTAAFGSALHPVAMAAS
jgi:hypothetical protein